MQRTTPTTLPPTLLSLLCLAIFGCGGGTEPKVPTTITVAPDAVSFTALGQTQQLGATVTDQDGASIASPSITWSSSNEAVATVSPTGLVSAIGQGSAEVTGTAGAATATAVVTVQQVPAQFQKVAGDGQTVTIGQPTPVPLTVQANDANGAPIGGLAVSFSADAHAGSLSSTSATTGPDGRASTGFTPLDSGAQEVTATISGSPLSADFTETGFSPFTIELKFLTPVTLEDSLAFEGAKQRWQSIIVSELPDVPLSVPADSCAAGTPAVQQTIDDVMILVRLKNIDGPGNLVGQAGPCSVRGDTKLPILGVMFFDTSDLDVVAAAGLLEPVIVHEMGHVLGFGSIWSALNLLADPSLGGPADADPHFTGAGAIGAFNASGGQTYVASAKVPVENQGGLGTADGHWRDTVFGNELDDGQPGSRRGSAEPNQHRLDGRPGIHGEPGRRGPIHAHPGAPYVRPGSLAGARE